MENVTERASGRVVEKVIERGYDGVNLPIELGTMLSMSIKDNCDRINCRLIGMDAGEFVIVKLVEKDLFYSLTEAGFIGKETMVTYVHNGVVFGFLTTIIGALSLPPGFLFIQYPESVEQHNLRREPRLNCLLPAKFIVNYVPIHGTVVDISMIGCRYKAGITAVTQKILKDQVYTLKIQLPGVGDILSFNVKARSISKDEEYVYLGISFEGQKGRDREILEHFIDNPGKLSAN